MGLAFADVGAADEAPEGRWYVKGFGGFTSPKGTDLKFRLREARRLLRGRVRYGTGYVADISAGYQMTPEIAFELQYTRRRSDMDEWTATGTGPDVGMDGRISSDSLMFNALYRFTDIRLLPKKLKPYVGVGAGVAKVGMTLSDEVESVRFRSDPTFGYQVFGGVSYDITPNVSLVGEGRWFNTKSRRLETGDGGFADPVRINTVDFLLGASFRF